MDPAEKSVPQQTLHLPLSAIPANVLSQLQEVPTNLSSARIFKLPPGVVLLKPSVGQILPASSPVIPGNIKTALQSQPVQPASTKPELASNRQQGLAVKVNDKKFKITTKPSTSSITPPVLKWQSANSGQAVVATTASGPVRLALPSASTQEITEKMMQQVVLLKTIEGKNVSTSNAVTPVGAQQASKWLHAQPVTALQLQSVLPMQSPVTIASNGQQGFAVKLSDKTYQIALERPPLPEPIPIYAKPTAVQKGAAINKDSGKDESSKPKPWSRDPRPTWKSKEPIVMYSGCKPENLEPKKKKEEPPKSLPCPEELDEMLPKSWEYHISSFEKLPDPNKFKAEIRTNMKTKEDALQWLRDFEAITGTNFRVTKTFKENSFRIVFKKCFKCHKNTGKKDRLMKRASGRNLGCEARLSITIKNSDMKSSNDLLLTRFPCVIGIFHNHCHSLTADALRHRRPLPELKEKFSNMFKAKITPAAARRLHMQDLQREYGDKYADVVQDTAKCPPLPWCYRLYYQIVGRKVKDGRKKSNRRSYYKKKTSILPRKPGQAERDPVIMDFTSENVMTNSYQASGLEEKRECEEIQRSINSLYEYDFMSKGGETREDDSVNSVAAANETENDAAPSNNSQEDPVMDNSELLSNHGEASNDNVDYMDSTDLLDNTECVGEFVTSGEILNPDRTLCNEDVEMTEQALNHMTNPEDPKNEEIEMAKQNLINVFNDLSRRLISEPQKYLSALNHFTSQYDQCQIRSDSDLVTALLEFGSQKSQSSNNVPSNLDNSISTIVEKCLVKKQTSAPSEKPENVVSPKRKVLVLRMDPNKFSQIMGRVGQNPNKNVMNI